MIINGRFLTQSTTGVQRFAREIIRASATQNLLTPSNATLLAPHSPDIESSFFGLSVRQIGKHQGHLWEQVDLPRAAGDDFTVNFCNTAPIALRRQMVVLHDASVAANPQNFTFAFRTWYKMMIRAYGGRAQQIGTVSKFSAGEISKYFGIPLSKIEVIPESGEHILRETPDFSIHEKFGLDPDSYFLAVSSLSPNKNFLGVLQAVARLPSLPFKFVIVGGRNAKIFSSNAIDTNGAVEVGFVSDAQLRALYERAACFVYPSLYEGFGLPPLEAMSCGCPVLVSNTSSLPEVCGDAAIYCDPCDPSDISKKLGMLLGSPETRRDLRQAGLVHAQKWTWKRAAARFYELIERAA